MTNERAIALFDHMLWAASDELEQAQEAFNATAEAVAKNKVDLYQTAIAALKEAQKKEEKS